MVSYPRLFSILLTGLLCLGSINVLSQENIALTASKISTSHVSTWENLLAINNNIDPENSGDKTGGAYGNWTGNLETWQWVEYSWDKLYIIERSDIYWWTDNGGIQIPYETYQEYWDFQSESWIALPNITGNGIMADEYNISTFSSVLTNKIRVHMVSSNATGILEWRVWGVEGEQVPIRSTTEMDNPLDKNSSSQLILVAKNELNEVVEGYKFKLKIDIANELTTTNEAYIINGIEFTSSVGSYELPATDQNGEVILSVNLPASIDPMDGISIQPLFNSESIALGDSYSFFEPGLTPPQLFADESDNTIDNTIDINFTDNPAWRSAIKHVLVEGTALSLTSDYEILPGIIRLKPSGGNPLLTLSGVKSVYLTSTGYEPTSVDQTILPGTTDAETTSLRTLLTLYRPTSTSIELIARDQFGNPVTNYSFSYDVNIINTDASTAETYQLAGDDVTESIMGQVTPLSDENGIVTIAFNIPREIDLNDGIEISFKLEDATLLQSDIAYINKGTDKQIVVQNAVKKNAGFSWSRTAQSENFIVYWGQKIQGDPTDPVNGSISFNPQGILEILEGLLNYFIDSVGMIANPDSLNMGTYKHEIVMNETWDNDFTGYAFGGWADEKIGGMWIHPNATGGPAVLAHEFTHMNQCMIFLQYPGYGLNMPYAGFFWESHANFMMKTYTKTYTGVQADRYIFTSMMHFSTTRRLYQNIYFLDYLNDKYGMETINDIWRKADPTSSHPLTSLRDSVLRYSQDDLNDEFGYHAMKNVTWDYSGGKKIKSAIAGINPIYVQRMYTMLDSIVDEPGRFIVPEYLAPGDYGYNIVPLFPDEGSNEISLTFTGIENDPAGGAGWRYGFVSTDNTGSPRYSPLYSDPSATVSYPLLASDSAVYLVVTGAPSTHHNYAWEVGYPKIYRYPWSIQLSGALPAGHKSGYNSQKETVPGAPHSNGGGWVSSSASVSSGAYVGPEAQVLGQAKVLDEARIEGFAIVTDNATVRNTAIVRDNAIVGGESVVSNNAIVEKSARVYLNSTIRDNAAITGSALIYNTTLKDNAIARDLARLSNSTLSGTTIVGGDAEEYNGYTSGTYLQMNRVQNSNVDALANQEVNPLWEEYTYPKGEKPLAPQNLSVSSISSRSAVISWDPSEDYREVELYYIYINGVFSSINSGTSLSLNELNPSESYTITVKAVDRSGNVSELSTAIEITTLSKIQEKRLEKAFNVYPNPVNDYINLESYSDNTCTYAINDIQGKKISEGSFEGKLMLSKEEIGAAGIYFLTLSTKNISQTFKIDIVQ